MQGQEWEFEKRDLTIAGDLMFSTVFHDEELCRGLIETILSRRIKSVQMVESQRHLHVSLQSREGIVDVVATDAEGNVFDVEMQNTRRPALARRVRYYGSLIDVGMLARGDEFRDLRERVVAFVCAQDPFGDGLKRYTCQMTCRENGHTIDDGQLSVYLNVEGTRGESTPELDAFLAYVGDASRIENDYVRRVDDAVRAFRDDPVWKGKLMLWELKYREELAYQKDEARAEGLAEGKAEGRAQQLDELSRLADALEARNRSSELPKALRDPALRERLMQEFGIE